MKTFGSKDHWLYQPSDTWSVSKKEQDEYEWQQLAEAEAEGMTLEDVDNNNNIEYSWENIYNDEPVDVNKNFNSGRDSLEKMAERRRAYSTSSGTVHKN